MEKLGPISETLDTEFKRWLRLDAPDQAATLAKACIAMRNNDGGRVILGLDDTGHSVVADRPADVNTAYHTDDINALVGRFATPKFEVRVSIKEHEGAAHPELTIPGGIDHPVITRTGHQKIVRQNAVYIRTISNGRPSTCEPVTPLDWETLIAKCYDNRDAATARLLARHAPSLAALVGTGSTAAVEELNDRFLRTKKLLQLGRQQFDERWRERSKDAEKQRAFPGLLEVAAVVDGKFREVGVHNLLDTLFVQQPHMTGWPPWVDSRGFTKDASRPYVTKNGWEALVRATREMLFVDAVDFWRIEPTGSFYLLRTSENDTAETLLKRGVEPGKVFDWLLLISRTAEILATLKAFGTVLAVEPAKARIEVTCRWTGMRGRTLACWVKPERDGIYGQTAVDDTVVESCAFPMDESSTTLWLQVRQLIQPVCNLFGANLPDPLVQKITEETIQRRT